MSAIVINIIGGPGVGKTTVAAELFARMKKEGKAVENISEFTKELIWTGNLRAFEDRLYTHAMQNHRLFMMKDQLDYIITDSPLLLTSVYHHFYIENKHTESYNAMIDQVVEETWNYYHNITYYIHRNTSYTHAGRRENQEEAYQIDTLILQYLKDHHIPYKEVNVEEAAKQIYDDLMKEE